MMRHAQLAQALNQHLQAAIDCTLRVDQPHQRASRPCPSLRWHRSMRIVPRLRSLDERAPGTVRASQGGSGLFLRFLGGGCSFHLFICVYGCTAAKVHVLLHVTCDMCMCNMYMCMCMCACACLSLSSPGGQARTAPRGFRYKTATFAISFRALCRCQSVLYPTGRYNRIVLIRGHLSNVKRVTQSMPSDQLAEHWVCGMVELQTCACATGVVFRGARRGTGRPRWHPRFLFSRQFIQDNNTRGHTGCAHTNVNVRR